MSQADHSPLLFVLGQVEGAAAVTPTGTWTLQGSTTVSGDFTTTGQSSISNLTLAQPTVGSGTVANNGRQSTGWYSTTVAYTSFVTAGTTSDVTLLTLGAKQKLLAVYADTTVAYAGLAGTIAIKVGSSTGGNELLLSHDVKTAAVTKGILEADLGASMAIAGMVQGGYLPSWTTTTALKVRLTSGTGNIGTGTATSMTAGSTKYYFKIETVV